MPPAKKTTTKAKPKIDEEKYLAAKQRVSELRDFYSHLGSYFVVNFFLIAVNLLTSPDHLWFYWVTIGWGIGLFIHGMNVYGYETLFGKDWEEKKIKEILEKDKD